MPIVLKRVDHIGNVYYLTRADDGGISLASGRGVSLSLGYAFGQTTAAQIELEERVTPEDFLETASRHDRAGAWTIEQSAYDPRKTVVPAIHTVEYTDSMRNRYFLRKYESGRVSLVSNNGIPHSLSDIIPQDAQGVKTRLAMCNSAAELLAVLREAVYQPQNLRAFPERKPAPPPISPELEQALQMVAALINDDDGTAVEAAEELLARYGIEVHGEDRGPKPAPRRPR